MACRLVAPSHYLNQCRNIVNFTDRNKLQWNVNQYTYIFSQENTFENAICEMAAILSRSQCIKCRHLSCGKRNIFSSTECTPNNLRNRSKLWPEIWCKYDDVIKWKHFPRYRPFVRGIHQWLVNSQHKGYWHGALMFSLICTWINGWVNNREAGDLRRHRAHYDVIVMMTRMMTGTLTMI